MKQTLLYLLLSGGSMLMAGGDPATAQIERGRQFFQHSRKGVACVACHALEGQGYAVGPDLTKLASVIGPRGLATTIQMTATAYVQEFQLLGGRKFPGIEKEKTGELVEVFDLGRIPAVLLKLKSSDILSRHGTSDWCHPPTAAQYKAEELADIIAYLKFVATGTPKEISATELR